MSLSLLTNNTKHIPQSRHGHVRLTGEDVASVGGVDGGGGGGGEEGVDGSGEDLGICGVGVEVSVQAVAPHLGH